MRWPWREAKLQSFQVCNPTWSLSVWSTRGLTAECERRKFQQESKAVASWAVTCSETPFFSSPRHIQVMKKTPTYDNIHLLVTLYKFSFSLLCFVGSVSTRSLLAMLTRNRLKASTHFRAALSSQSPQIFIVVYVVRSNHFAKRFWKLPAGIVCNLWVDTAENEAPPSVWWLTTNLVCKSCSQLLQSLHSLSVFSAYHWLISVKWKRWQVVTVHLLLWRCDSCLVAIIFSTYHFLNIINEFCKKKKLFINCICAFAVGLPVSQTVPVS